MCSRISSTTSLSLNRIGAPPASRLEKAVRDTVSPDAVSPHHLKQRKRRRIVFGLVTRHLSLVTAYRFLNFESAIDATSRRGSSTALPPRYPTSGLSAGHFAGAENCLTMLKLKLAGSEIVGSSVAASSAGMTLFTSCPFGKAAYLYPPLIDYALLRLDCSWRV